MDGGTLTTRPLSFEGSELSLNSVGPVSIELLDASGKKLGAAGVAGDSLRHRVRFGGKSLRAAAGAGAVRLRLTVGEGGALYSFTAN